MTTLATRMCNEADGAKQLLLWGLPGQAQPLIRHIIECMMLFRLFLQKPKMASCAVDLVLLLLRFRLHFVYWALEFTGHFCLA